jgi:hypothetical protein
VEGGIMAGEFCVMRGCRDGRFERETIRLSDSLDCRRWIEMHGEAGEVYRIVELHASPMSATGDVMEFDSRTGGYVTE